MPFWYPGRTNLTFIFQSAGRKARSGCFQCEQLLRSAAAAQNAINCMSRHDAECLLTSWPPRRREWRWAGRAVRGHTRCSACCRATLRRLPSGYNSSSLSTALSPNSLFSCLTPGQPWFPRNRYNRSQVSTCSQVWNTTQYNAVQCDLSMWSLECYVRRWFKPAAFDLRTQPTFIYYRKYIYWSSQVHT